MARKPKRSRVTYSSTSLRRRMVPLLAVLFLAAGAMGWTMVRSASAVNPSETGLAWISSSVSSSLDRFLVAMFSPRPVRPPARHPLDGQMELKGIILSREHPVVMINSTPFEKGETAPLRMEDGNRAVQCLDIEPTQVRVQTEDSDPVILQLKEQPTVQ